MRRRPEGLPGRDRRSVPGNGRAAVHSAPDQELAQVCREQEPEGVPCRLEARIPSKDARKGGNGTWKPRHKMGRKIPDSRPFLAGELAQPEPLFSVYRRHPQAHLHDQHRRGLPPPGSQGDEDEGRVHIRRLPRQAGLSRIPQYQEEMDDAACKLVADCATAVHQVRRPVRNFIIFAKESNNGR